MSPRRLKKDLELIFWEQQANTFGLLKLHLRATPQKPTWPFWLSWVELILVVLVLGKFIRFRNGSDYMWAAVPTFLSRILIIKNKLLYHNINTWSSFSVKLIKKLHHENRYICISIWFYAFSLSALSLFLVAACLCLTESRSHGNRKINSIIKRLEMGRDPRFEAALAHVQVSDDNCDDYCTGALVADSLRMLMHKSTQFTILFIHSLHWKYWGSSRLHGLCKWFDVLWRLWHGVSQT